MFEDYIFKQIGGEELSDIQILLCSLESFAKELTSDNSSGLQQRQVCFADISAKLILALVKKIQKR